MGLFVLLFSVAGLLAVARGLTALADEDSPAVTAAVALAALMVLPLELCHLTENMVAATLAAGVVAAAAAYVLRGRLTVPSLSADLPGWAKVGGAVVLFLGVYAAIRGYWWDEYFLHYGVAGAVARGVVPPVDPVFPDEVFRYHYGYDVLAGIVYATTPLAIQYALDVVTIACLVLLLALAARTGRQLAGRDAAGLSVVLVLLGSGLLQYPLYADMGSIAWPSPFPERWTQDMPPPIVSNFFQHPQGLGMPLALAVLLLWFPREGRRGLLRTLLATALLAALSLAQSTFFLVLGLALGAGVLVQRLRAEPRTEGGAEGDASKKALALDLLCLAASLGLAFALGGFFSTGRKAEAMFDRRSAFGEPFLTALWHHVVLFGVPFLAIPFYAVRTWQRPRPLRVALLVAVAVGFAVPNIVTYKGSHDIVKLFGIGGFFANLLLADLLAPLLERGRGRRAVAGLVVALATLASVVWVARMGVIDGRFGIPPMHFPPPPAIAPAVKEKLDPLLRPKQRVFSTNIDMSMVGLLTPGFSYYEQGAYVYQMDEAAVNGLHRRYEAARHGLQRQDLDALGVDYVVLSPGDIDALDETGKRALEDPTRLEHVFDVAVASDVRRVYRVVR